MSEDKTWYQSRTIWGALITIIASLAHLAGATLSQGDQAALADTLVTLAGALGGLYAIYGRLKAQRRVK